MPKIIMKRVPQKINRTMQHQVIRNWSTTIVESHTPKSNIRIYSAKELLQQKESKNR